MNRRAILLVVSGFAIAAPLGACEKDKGGSGALDASDQAMFEYLPAGQTLLFGGNYMKLQNFMQSALGKLSSALVSSMGSGMTDWMTCFGDLGQLKIAASASFTGATPQLRMVMTGATVDQIAGCADKAGFKHAVDADKKYMSIELPLPAPVSAYLVLPSGAIYTRAPFGLQPDAKPFARADLEGDISALGGKTAADDAAFKSLVTKVDRSKTIWFVGHADGTPAADKVGEVWGTMDLGDGLALDVTFTLKDAAIAEKIEQGLGQAKEHADELPGEVKDVVKAIKLDRSGDQVHVTAKATDAQIKSIAGSLGGMLGASRHH
jgi:hypothetical protein